MLIFFGIILIIILLLIMNQKRIAVTHYQVLGKGPRFLVLSDFHNNPYLPFSQFQSILKNESFHVILLLGDLIDRKGGKENTQRLLSLLKQTSCPVYYVQGNHELHAPDAAWLKEELHYFAKCLAGKTAEFEGIKLSGIAYGKQAEEAADLYLCHNPMDGIRSTYPGLYLAGHTHGGQVRIPLLGAIYVPGQPFFPKYVKGLYSLENKQLLITSGLGNTLAPLRLFNPVEVLIIS